VRTAIKVSPLILRESRCGLKPIVHHLNAAKITSGKTRALMERKLTLDLHESSSGGSRGLGSGHPQIYLPIWMQKDFEKWTIYGGGGYWINPGPNNQNWGFVGCLLQRQLTSNFALGTEVFHQTPQQIGGESNTHINAGGTLDLSELQHVLFSVGHTLQVPGGYQAYLAIQFTFGPEEKK